MQDDAAAGELEQYAQRCGMTLPDATTTLAAVALAAIADLEAGSTAGAVAHLHAARPGPQAWQVPSVGIGR